MIERRQTSEYISGSRSKSESTHPMLSLASLGIPAESMDAWSKLQGFFERGEVTPCYGRSQLFESSRKADREQAARLCDSCVARPACAEYAQANNERGATWGGEWR